VRNQRCAIMCGLSAVRPPTTCMMAKPELLSRRYDNNYKLGKMQRIGGKYQKKFWKARVAVPHGKTGRFCGTAISLVIDDVYARSIEQMNQDNLVASAVWPCDNPHTGPPQIATWQATIGLPQKFHFHAQCSGLSGTQERRKRRSGASEQLWFRHLRRQQLSRANGLIVWKKNRGR
jgi:hypothetical protein